MNPVHKAIADSERALARLNKSIQLIDSAGKRYRMVKRWIPGAISGSGLDWLDILDQMDNLTPVDGIVRVQLCNELAIGNSVTPRMIRASRQEAISLGLTLEIEPDGIWVGRPARSR